MTVTQGAQWRKEMQEGVEMALPSGFKARIRGVNLSTFIEIGNIPDLLTPLVVEMVNGKVDPQNMTIEDYRKYVDIYDAFCETCFVSPRVVDDPQAEDEIGLEHICDEDKMFVFAFLGRPAMLLESFRQRQNFAMESVDDQPGGSPESVGMAGGGALGESVSGTD